MARVFVGTAFHAEDADTVVCLEDAALVVGTDGKIAAVGSKGEVSALRDRYDIDSRDVITLSKGQFLTPGFVDTHCHAAQYSYAGTGLDLPLMKWLDRYTFPAESRLSDSTLAKHVYQQAVNATLRYGSTAVAYFATIYTDTTLQLCDIIESAGQRGFVGKVNMDSNSPDFYRETSTQSFDETRRFVETVHSRGMRNITPVITPRFTVNCSQSLMDDLGRLSEQYQLPIQTHINENCQEIELVKTLRPECKNYLETYSRSGLINERTILAHCIYNTAEETEYIRKVGAGISHCPTSNLSIRSGVMDARHYLDLGVKLSLGTDVAGGYSPSMIHAMRTAVLNSNVCSFSKEKSYRFLSHNDAFYLATLGGCQVLRIDKQAGNFKVGKDFDALIVDTTVENSPVDIFEQFDSIEDLFQKFIFNGDDRNIASVFVQGKPVLGGRIHESLLC